MSLIEAFDRVVRDRGDEVLLDAPGERVRLTARDILAMSVEIERAFAQAGIGAGHLVLSAAGNRAAMPSLVLACLRASLPLMPIEHGTPAGEIVALCERWDTAVVVGLAGDPPILAAATYVGLPGGLAAGLVEPQPDPGRHGKACLLKLTSGSTGPPKATSTEERHLIADVRHITSCMEIGPHTRQLGVIPLSHSYGFSNLLLPLLWQGTPLRLRTTFVPVQVLPDLIDGALETFAGVPFMFEHLVRHQPGRMPRALRLVVSAGAPLAFDTVEAFHATTGLKIRSFYGSSETGGICFDDSDTLDPEVPVGRPMGDTRVTLVADADAPGGSGRVQVEGPNVVDRYASEDSAFAGRYLTGDFGRWTDDGRLVLTGRAASFVNVAGRKVQPHEVEAALRDLPGVLDAVVLALDDEVRGEALGACLASSAPLTPPQVRAALALRLAPHKLPRVIVSVPALPLTARGKIDRDAALRLLQRQRGDGR